MSIDLKTLNGHYSKTNCSIYLKFIGLTQLAFKSLHINFQAILRFCKNM